jgi:transposase
VTRRNCACRPECTPSNVNGAPWTQLVAVIGYKAANAGGGIVYVGPRGTSQECPA